MRQTTERHQLFDYHRPMHFGALGKIGDPTSALGGRIIAERPSPAAHQSSRGSQQMGKDAQKTRLAGAVRPDQPDELAALDRGVDLVQHGSSASDSLAPQAQHQQQEKRRADQRSKNAKPQFWTGAQPADGNIGSKDETPAAKRARHQQPARLMSDQWAEQMRDDEADKPDRAADRDRSADGKGGAEDQPEANALQREAETARGLFAKRQRVERAAAAQQQNPAYGHQRGGKRDMIEAAVD